jgi:4-hydroxy 2-oxovalerate aldolase
VTNDCQLLDCTLRDGSYALHFGFTAAQTTQITHALIKQGIAWVEVGHGVGLGASQQGYGQAAESDLHYAQAAQAGLLQAGTTPTLAQWGMFAIPGIARLDDITMAADEGMGFVRLGISLDKLEHLPTFAHHARKLGLITICNVMKSYTMPSDGFARLAQRAVDEGCDGVYLVDSAGGMRPDEVLTYLTALKRTCPQTLIGFHGHNNLGLAVANALIAWQHGASLVDTSLQGLGRSAGNTPTEQLACVLKRLDPDFTIDPLALMQMAADWVQPLTQGMVQPGLDAVDMTCGLAQFHSSYLPVLEAAAAEHQADLKRLILAVAEVDPLNAPDPLVYRLAKQLAGTGFNPLRKPYIGQEQS